MGKPKSFISSIVNKFTTDDKPKDSEKKQPSEDKKDIASKLEPTFGERPKVSTGLGKLRDETGLKGGELLKEYARRKRDGKANG